MRSTDQAIRQCIDRFADDLIDLAEQVVRDQVSKALARIKPPPPPASRRQAKAEKATEPRPGRRKLSAVEKLERARARAEERKRQRQLALPFSGEGAESEAKPTRRGRRKATEAPPKSTQKPAQAAAPAPLFVVKRTRDGAVQAMQRKADGEPQPGEPAPAE